MEIPSQMIRIGLCALALGAGGAWRATADQITAVALVPSGSATVPRLTLEGTVGTTNQIQYCTNLSQSNWRVLTNLVVAKSPYWFEDVGAPAAPSRFYRVMGPTPETMVLIPAGSFTMGDPFSEGWSGERPLHTVYVSALYMDRYEVTKALWDEVKAWNGGNGYNYENTGAGKAATHPVQMVNWRDCIKWCNARSEKEGRTPCYYNEASLTTVYKTGTDAPYPKWDANGYRLPTEAEWEKAARGGVGRHRFPWSNVDTIMHSQANYCVFQYQSSGTNYYAFDKSPTVGYHPGFNDRVWPYTSPVGCFEANGYGLHDMAGNVWEWCWDWYGSYSSDFQSDPRGPVSGSSRVYRGGSWYNHAIHSRTAIRYSYATAYRNYDLGFRCVLPAVQ